MVLRNPSGTGASSDAGTGSGIGAGIVFAGHRRKSSSDGEGGLGGFNGPLRALEAGLREHEARRDMYRRVALPGGPTLVRHKYLQFLISSAPSSVQAPRYAGYLLAQGVRNVVRVCEPTYNAAVLRGASIGVHDWIFPDGDAPPPDVVAKWLKLMDEVFDLANDGAGTRDEVVAVHCKAGLGRAPVLVAIALIEAGAHPFEAVGTIRAQRRGAINARQMAFLEAYTPRRVAKLHKVPKRGSDASSSATKRNSGSLSGSKEGTSPRNRRQTFGFAWMKRSSNKNHHVGC